jgi:acylphosphatase
MIVHYKITVKGRVQGVWFRKYTKQAAVSRDLNGFVQNQPDGNVYIEVEGAESNVQDFIKWLDKGSPLSEVKEVNISEGDFVGFSGFEITR